MNLKLNMLTFKEIFQHYGICEQEIEYGGVSGQAEMVVNFFAHKFLCFKKGNGEKTSAISLTEIENSKERRVGNVILKEIGIGLKFGDIIDIKEIEKVCGTPVAIDNDFIDMFRYHYSISPDLFICIGVKEQNNKLVHLEIINDAEVISEIIDFRKIWNDRRIYHVVLDRKQYYKLECLLRGNNTLSKYLAENKAICGYELFKEIVCELKLLKEDGCGIEEYGIPILKDITAQIYCKNEDYFVKQIEAEEFECEEDFVVKFDLKFEGKKNIVSKYTALWEYVQKSGSDFLQLTFEQIQNIINIPIDHSFLKYKKELIQYGYQVNKISMNKKIVTFHKIVTKE